MEPIRLCPSCRHYREPRRVAAFAPGSSHSPGQFRSVTQMMGNDAKLRAIEQQRVQGRVPLTSEPGFFPWCGKFTPDTLKVAAVREGLLEGNTEPYDQAQQEGLEFAIDYANGTVKAVYALCLRKNPSGHCAGFERRKEATR